MTTGQRTTLSPDGNDSWLYQRIMQKSTSSPLALIVHTNERAHSWLWDPRQQDLVHLVSQDGTRFPVHRPVLTNWSVYAKELLSEFEHTNQIDVPFSEDEVELLCAFLYANDPQGERRSEKVRCAEICYTISMLSDVFHPSDEGTVILPDFGNTVDFLARARELGVSRAECVMDWYLDRLNSYITDQYANVWYQVGYPEGLPRISMECVGTMLRMASYFDIKDRWFWNVMNVIFLCECVTRWSPAKQALARDLDGMLRGFLPQVSETFKAYMCHKQLSSLPKRLPQEERMYEPDLHLSATPKFIWEHTDPKPTYKSEIWDALDLLWASPLLEWDEHNLEDLKRKWSRLTIPQILEKIHTTIVPEVEKDLHTRIRTEKGPLLARLVERDGACSREMFLQSVSALVEIDVPPTKRERDLFGNPLPDVDRKFTREDVYDTQLQFTSSFWRTRMSRFAEARLEIFETFTFGFPYIEYMFEDLGWNVKETRQKIEYIIRRTRQLSSCQDIVIIIESLNQRGLSHPLKIMMDWYYDVSGAETHLRDVLFFKLD